MNTKTEMGADQPDDTRVAARQVLKLFLFFILLTLFAPLAIGLGVFGGLMTIEGTALPWLSFLIVPLIYMGVLLPQAFKTGRQIHRLAAQLDRGGALIQALMEVSIVWIIIGNIVVFKLVVALIS